ncbi:cory-CC-star protein [Brevibacillus humidisoli]|uniref:cory-CC-star protein n=1 Tax=Brevibacillus humidisoli TaxID=2895522 RepID=UPI003B977EAB
MQGYEELFYVRYRREIRREIRNEEDLFLLLCFSEMLGLPNPVSYYTLELYPAIYERFHEWHTRMGMERSPLDDIRCC